MSTPLLTLRRSLVILCVALAASADPEALAFTPTRDSEGRTVRWAGGSVYLPLVGNPGNRSGISASAFFDSVVRGLRRWEKAAQGAIRFDYWQGTDTGTYSAGSSMDQFSRVYFASQNLGSQLGPSVLGLTQVWYDTRTGEILEADVALNDLAVQFTLDPRDTTGSGAGVTRGSYGARRVYLENVLTHELGHAFGLSHTGTLFSTMLAVETAEQAHLGCDDQVGIQSVFGRVSGRGRIQGSVRDPGGRGVFGAHVQALSLERGVPLASSITDSSGNYSIDGLEPGSYTVMVESVATGVGSISAHLGAATQDPCVAAGLARTFLKDGAELVRLEVPSGGTAQAPVVSVTCGPAALSYNSDRVESLEEAANPATAPVILQGNAGVRDFAIIDRFQFSLTQSYRLVDLVGDFEVHALGPSISSALRPRLTLLNAAGAGVASAVETSPVDLGASGLLNHDAHLVARNLPAGDYILQVRYQGLSPFDFPGGSGTVDSIPFVVLVGGMGAISLPAVSALADQARCRMDESFSRYSSPDGGPARSLSRQSSAEEEGFGFCGGSARAAELGRRGRRASVIEDPLKVMVRIWAGYFPWVFGLGLLRLASRRKARTPVA